MGEHTGARRADAERNRASIIEAALSLLSTDPRASMSDIANAAGVSRVTMYGHFSARSDLVRAAFERALADAQSRLAQVNLEGDPMAALERLVRASWRVVGPSRVLLAAAREELGETAVREAHHDASRQLERLVRRGRSEGAFRVDVPTGWLIACYQNVLHGAADELREGRLPERRVDAIVWATIRSLFVPE